MSLVVFLNSQFYSNIQIIIHFKKECCCLLLFVVASKMENQSEHFRSRHFYYRKDKNTVEIEKRKIVYTVYGGNVSIKRQYRN